ncbi:MAG: hypothetical protein MJ247_03250 [Alphaproteobacteria bacterium]|nr:hypothetical protein [Alphaproteobacteria bacterium]
MKHIFYLLLISTVMLTGCYTKCGMVAGFAPKLKSSYSNRYPTVELDYMAITEDEAVELSSISVEEYFSFSQLRKSLNPYTIVLSSEETEPQEMLTKVDNWDNWLDKNPEKIAVVVNIPKLVQKEKTDKDKNKDSRLLIYPLKKSWFSPRTDYLEIRPGNVIKIATRPVDPEAKTKKIAKQEKEDAIKKAEEEQKQEEIKQAEERKKKRKCRKVRCKVM